MSFLVHPDLFQHAGGGSIVCNALCPDTVQFQLSETESEESTSGFGRVAAALCAPPKDSTYQVFSPK